MTKLQKFEKIAAVLIIIATFIYIPLAIMHKGYMPLDDCNRDVAFSVTDKEWADVIVLEPGFNTDHNAGWHQILRFLNKRLNISKEGLIAFCVVSLFFILNVSGALTVPNSGAWLITLLIVFIAEPTMFGRMTSGRPFLVSCVSTLLVLRLWFIEPDKSLTAAETFVKYFLTLVLLSLGVWIHGSWYVFLILPGAMLIAGRLGNAFSLTVLILAATAIGSFMTGHFNEFLNYHFVATYNIYSEKVYNWQLVTENGEGNPGWFWIIPTAFLIMFLVSRKKIKLSSLASDPLFILILLTWLPAIKVIRFWADWGRVAMMFWLCYRLSDVIEDMTLVKKTAVRWLLFVCLIASTVLIITRYPWSQEKERAKYSVDFTKSEFAPWAPGKNGTIYNDNMFHFYYLFYNEPKADYRFALGFESATMAKENREIFRNITYTGYHFTAYKPWVETLGDEDRIFTSYDISREYPQLDWIRAAQNLWIGKKQVKDGKGKA